jgi:prepilin-type N-terminal cleavage/methylation domain-containing protein
MRRLTEERGFTIVEVMAAVVILLVGSLGTLAMLDTANQRTRTADDRQKATALAREVVEAARGIPYRELRPETVVSRLREDESLAGTSASPWRVERDGTVLTLTASVCWLDEPADGLGSRSVGGFCEGSGTGGIADTNPIDYKRVTVVASWSNGSGGGTVRQSTLIAGRGGDDAPGVSSVRLTSPPASPITSEATTSAAFAVTTDADAASVTWSVDGAPQGAAAGSGRNWTFSWPLPALDGAYDVAAEAFEQSGRGGELRSVTVVINRFAPVAPDNVRAGRNGAIVEVAWSANRERDVIGYRVFRQSTGTAEVVCNLTSETSCVDAAPPPGAGGVLDYWVVAVDRDPDGAEREGAPSARIDVNGQNSPPNQPVALTLSKDAQGNNVLRWNPPAVADPDTGDFIESYRVYRDGTEITDRYDRVPGTETTAVDPDAAGPHQYWVTAVDTHLSESQPLGPVSG